ncbi:MAG TPA: ADP-glyceromanno-heptose 6-epimerase [Isosphaeraceae bacterium]|jgi:ADP-L-glycero-D-manno-heptose 6-epimerase|nr:ADP-glyceromanno-heptose 6-epimerase [Isosphaeraceae bacterium]
MYIVTGAAGFIGSNIVRALNGRGIDEIVAVDTLEDGDRFVNLRDRDIADYLDLDEFRDLVRRGGPPWRVTAVLHQGACADTTEADGRYMMDNNYTFSKELLHLALAQRAPMVYASSASVYGAGDEFAEEAGNERPLNVYAYSKLQFDRYVRRLAVEVDTTVVGLRYFNVYGPNERFKGRMASMVYQLYNQLKDDGVARLFAGTGGFGDGEQRRDFVHVDDVAAVNLRFALEVGGRGVYNVGTGRARSFNDVARALIARLGRGEVRYVPFPASLGGKYQSFTEADLANLRAAGYDAPFLSLEEGIARSFAAWEAERGAGPAARNAA